MSEDAPKVWCPSDDELSDILANHRKWAQSNGDTGERADLTNADLSGRDFSESPILSYAILVGADLSEANLYRSLLLEVDLSEADLSGALLSRTYGTVDASGTKFSGANLVNAQLNAGDYSGAQFDGCDARSVEFGSSDFPNADLSEANFRYASFQNSNLSEADFTNSILQEVDFKRSNLTNTIFNNSVIKGADLRNTNINDAKYLKFKNADGANLRKLDLQNSHMHGLAMSGARLAYSDISESRLEISDLSDSFLYETDLSNSNLRESDLSGAYLRRATLSEAFLNLSDLSGANLMRSNLWSSYLEKTDLTNANLLGATLWGAKLTDANFRQANLRNAELGGTEGLQTAAIARSNVSNANLPDDVAKFDGLSTLDSASKSARKLFVALGFACAYAALAISPETSGEGTLTLPFVNVEISVWGFHIVTPILLAFGFGYFHLQMQRVWEEMSRLPAVFPDGKAIDQKVRPWLVTGLARAHVPFIRDRPLPMFPLQKLIVIVLAWGTVPLTQAYFVGSFVDRFPQHSMLSLLGATLVAATVSGAVVSYRTAKAHLRGEYDGPLRPFSEEENNSVRRAPNGRTLGWALLWTDLTFGLWLVWTVANLG